MHEKIAGGSFLASSYRPRFSNLTEFELGEIVCPLLGGGCQRLSYGLLSGSRYSKGSCWRLKPLVRFWAFRLSDHSTAGGKNTCFHLEMEKQFFYRKIVMHISVTILLLFHLPCPLVWEILEILTSFSWARMTLLWDFEQFDASQNRRLQRLASYLQIALISYSSTFAIYASRIVPTLLLWKPFTFIIRCSSFLTPEVSCATRIM